MALAEFLPSVIFELIGLRPTWRAREAFASTPCQASAHDYPTIIIPSDQQLWWRGSFTSGSFNLLAGSTTYAKLRVNRWRYLIGAEMKGGPLSVLSIKSAGGILAQEATILSPARGIVAAMSAEAMQLPTGAAFRPREKHTSWQLIDDTGTPYLAVNRSSSLTAPMDEHEVTFEASAISSPDLPILTVLGGYLLLRGSYGA